MPVFGREPRDWLIPRPEGLYCAPGDFFIDPRRPVARAVITHAHSDHARAGHGAVLATPGTLALMAARMGSASVAPGSQSLAYGRRLRLGAARLSLAPAGHVLGSAQVVIEHAGRRAVISGDYKRSADPTCAAFEPVACDLFVTEATFALPVFRHPPPEQEIVRLLASLRLFPERAHLVGTYALGKCQRLIALLRAAGYDRPIFLHGACASVCETYRALGIDLGDLRPLPAGRAVAGGEVVLAPPGALADRWSRRLAEMLPAMASGWMALRQHARARGVELPLVISDHADWDGLLATIAATGAGTVWITHGPPEALMHVLSARGVVAEPLGGAQPAARRGEEED